MAPHRDADVDLLADGLVVLVERLVAARQEVQHRRVHHDIRRADRLRVLGKLDHRVHVLVRARGDDARRLADKVIYDSKSQRWLFYSRPHVRMQLRRMFESAQAHSASVIQLSHSEGNARNIHWFLMRYPHEMNVPTRMLLLSTVAAAEERERQCEDILAGKTGTLGLTYALAKPARAYQTQAIELAYAMAGLLCGDDLGLGKTLVGIGLASIADTRPVLVVCQTHLQKQWRAKFGEFAPMLKVEVAKTGKPHDTDADVLIMTYTKMAGWVGGPFVPRSLIFDEVQELRHDESAKYKAAAAFAAEAAYKLGLSATPVYNYGGEIWNICNILRKGALGERSEFVKEWCSSSLGGKMIVSDPQALGAYLRECSLMIRRTRADVGRELPPVQSFAEQVPYDEDVMKGLTDDALQLAKVILSAKSGFLEKGQAARELDIKLRQATGIAKAPFVAEMVMEMVASGKKVLLAGWHREVYAIWEAKFKEAGVRHWMYTGSESVTGKDDSAKGFIGHNGGCVLIISNRSGAGLDGLQKVCDTVVFGELDWSPQVHGQLIGRLQRDDQMHDNGISVFYLVSDAGSDPIIASLLGIKMEQGSGITDPDIDMETFKLADKLSDLSEEQANGNRIAALAKAFVLRYGGGASASSAVES